eukprot:CAMPEP_0194060388 /NCGR_PEP_ID=MMETSP0009_2-20130614/71609_1 /TAXON_ID=210454 /ORGANISM="Grammatophora oceanica, Strain CCMP 410" /LENGTH=36 /DNA_ID= /DNA_START= /DNA_END= /DNA_ORIENTATION=
MNLCESIQTESQGVKRSRTALTTAQKKDARKGAQDG